MDVVDTRYYWNLTKHIFRYNHHGGQLTGNNGVPSGVHTVNEREYNPLSALILYTNRCIYRHSRA